MKIYIAGRITGNPHYKAEFKEAETALQCAGHTVLNPAELPEGMKPADYMRICFAMLDSADMVFMQYGWHESKGANLEYDYARYIGKAVISTEGSCSQGSLLKAIALAERSVRDNGDANG